MEDSKVIKFEVELHLIGGMQFTGAVQVELQRMVQSWLNEKIQHPGGSLFLLVNPITKVLLKRPTFTRRKQLKRRIQ